MTLAFADSYFYLALMNPRDAGHKSAHAVAEEFEGTIVTTQWILVEVADAFAHPRHRPLFERLLSMLSTDSRVTVVPADNALFERGVELFLNRADKDWPLTDCISFLVMKDLEIQDVFTADSHFAQAGYTLLLTDSEG